MHFDGARTWLREIGVDIAPRVEAPIASQARVTNALAGLVILSVGRGGPLQAAVNRALKASGAVILVKASVADVLQMLRAFVPSAIVTEVVPGDDDAYALLRAVRKVLPEHGGPLPVIGASGETLDPAPMMQAGFQGAIVFPFEAVDVARTMLHALGRPV